jgi:hypothetical protein
MKMSGSYETEKAIMEAERNAATDAYFKARPKIDTPENWRIFEAGFERAWDSWKNDKGPNG